MSFLEDSVLQHSTASSGACIISAPSDVPWALEGVIRPSHIWLSRQSLTILTLNLNFWICISFSSRIIDNAEKDNIVQRQESLVSHKCVLFRLIFALTAFETLLWSIEDESTISVFIWQFCLGTDECTHHYQQYIASYLNVSTRCSINGPRVIMWNDAVAGIVLE